MTEVREKLTDNMDKFRPAAEDLIELRRQQGENYMSFQDETLPSPFDELGLICNISVWKELPDAVDINVICADSTRLGYFLVPHPTSSTLEKLKEDRYKRGTTYQVAPYLYRYGGKPASVIRHIYP